MLETIAPALMTIRVGRIVDLSHELTPAQDPTPLDVTLRRERKTPYTRIQSALFIGTHTGTHMKAERHLKLGGWDASTIPLENCIGPAVVLNFAHKGLKEEISLDEIKAAADIKVGDRVLLHVAGDKRYRTPDMYNCAFPSAEACRWLAEDRKISLFGTDANAFDVKGDPTDPNHRIFLESARIPVIENLAHLDDLRKPRFWLVAVPLRIKELDASPIRAFAIEEPG